MRFSVLSARLLTATCVLSAAAAAAAAQPFLSDSQWLALRDASSGSIPYDNLRVLTTLHRVPATDAFDQAAGFVLNKALEYGLRDAQIERFPIDGTTQYGLMRSYWGWSVQSARLWQSAPQSTLLADWSTDPIRLADYSRSSDVEADLIDVGAGTSESDYAAKDVAGKIVLADGVLSEVQALAVMKFGAAGIVSDMPNQSTAWSGLDATLVRWGHLDARLPRGFAFMVSKAAATDLRAQMAKGTTVRLRAQVKAEVGPGHWSAVTATIPGTDPAAGDIVFSCHLDHERPGANDNASGCVTILESARVLQQQISAGRLARPARTLRFIWSPEIEGTMAYLARYPQIRRRLRVNVHMDMVGGDPFKDKSILHVTETPWSLPSFVTDVGAAFAGQLRDAAAVYAEDGSHADEAVLEDRNGIGTRNAFFVDRTPYAEGSDHDVYDSSTVAVPSLYLRDKPDVYIHTDHDSLDTIDATKLRRVALLGAAAGFTYASLQATQIDDLLPYMAAQSQQRLAQASERAQSLLQKSIESADDAGFEARNLLVQVLRRETRALQGFVAFTGGKQRTAAAAITALNEQHAHLERWLDAAAARRGLRTTPPAWHNQTDAARVPRRIAEFGPLNYMNDDVLTARLGKQRVAAIRLFNDDSNRPLGVQGQGELYAYEIVNFIDGQRSVVEIRDAVAAEFGPLPLALVSDYLQACEEARIIAFR
jgi:hypothetical protein